MEVIQSDKDEFIVSLDERDLMDLRLISEGVMSMECTLKAVIEIGMGR